MTEHHEIYVLTDDDYDVKYIGEQVKATVANSKIQNGIVTIVTSHTSTGISVTEPLDCILSDLEVLMRKLVNDDEEYSHAHFLPTYGRTSANAPGHLRSILTGNSCIFPIQGKKMMMGAAQEILLMEFDGPQNRKIYIDIIGD